MHSQLTVTGAHADIFLNTIETKPGEAGAK